jgi:hypothetical protein
MFSPIDFFIIMSYLGWSTNHLESKFTIYFFMHLFIYIVEININFWSEISDLAIELSRVQGIKQEPNPQKYGDSMLRESAHSLQVERSNIPDPWSWQEEEQDVLWSLQCILAHAQYILQPLVIWQRFWNPWLRQISFSYRSTPPLK